MGWVYLESGAVTQFFQPPGEVGCRYRCGSTAFAADDVLMGRFCREVINSGTMSEMAVYQESGFLESIQGPIHRRLVGLAVRGSADFFQYRRRGEVLIVLPGNDGADGPPCCGDAEPLIT